MSAPLRRIGLVGAVFETLPQDNLRTLRLVEDIYAQNPAS